MSGNGRTGGRFRDQIVLLTGGSRGIGRAIALAFAREGADLVLNYARNHDAARNTAAAIESEGRRCVLVAGSVGDPECASRLVRVALENFSRIDILVNNAGITCDGNLMLLRDAAWREILNVNLNGTFSCCQAVLETMIAQRSGVIVNMTSTAGLKGRGGQVSYAATKGAVIALTKSLAQELGPYGIRVNALAPGFIETELVQALLARPGLRETFLAETPVGRLGTGEDVADAALFLASQESAFVSGHTLLINGGLFM